MRRTGKALALFALAVAAMPLQSAPPVTAYTNFARYEAMQISPGGKFLALTQRTAEGEIMTILNYPDLSLSGRTQFGRLMDVRSFVWADDSRLLVHPERRLPGFTSYKVPTGEIIGMDADTKNAGLLFGIMAGRGNAPIRGNSQQPMFAAGEVIDTLPDDPENVLIQTKGFGIEGEANGAFRMNVKTGRLQRIAGSPLNNGNFLIDSNHRLVFLVGQDRKGDNKIYRRNEEKRDWELFASYEARRGYTFPVGETGKPDTYLAIDNIMGPTDGVVEWNPKTSEKRELFRRPGADVFPLGSDAQGKVWGFGYIEHFPEYWYPDPAHPLAQMHQGLRGTFRDATIVFTSHTRDLSLAVARVSAPLLPPTFLVVDLKSRRILQQLPAFPDLKREDLSPMEPFEFKARDGLTIRGYLTTPNVPNKKRLPLLVLVHGGPHGVQDAYVFDPEVQLLASRGYAVLQVNYRGSGGRGREFAGAGFGRWGREMQDDITDAVKWAIADGVADRARVCIMGTSYGAYAALTGAFREPDLFKCAVGQSGVYDLPMLYDKGDIQTVERGVRFLKEAVGTDEEELRQRSPVYNADRIQAAVMLVHGRGDDRAPYAHAEKMRAALRKAGNEPEWLSEWGEGHSMRDEGNRAETFEKVLAFLGKHLGAAPAP